jgi:hypothetical protein
LPNVRALELAEIVEDFFLIMFASSTPRGGI